MDSSRKQLFNIEETFYLPAMRLSRSSAMVSLMPLPLGREI